MIHGTLLVAGLYFVFGAAGTGARIALSPTIGFGLNKRTVVEILSGGMTGIVLPYVGFGILTTLGVDQAHIEAFPTIVKAALVWILNFTGSFAIGEIIARRQAAQEPKP